MSDRGHGGAPAAVTAVYGLLLRLHPPRFRADYGDEVMRCFHEGWSDDVRGRGLGAAVAFCWRVAWGTVATSVRQRMSGSGGSPKRTTGREAGTMGIDSIRQDLGVAWRGLMRRPAWAAVVVITLGVGMGATLSMFSVMNAVLLAPLPYPEGERLVRVYNRNIVNGSDRLRFSTPGAVELRERARSFRSVAILSPLSGANLTGSDRPERVRTLGVNAEYFDAIGIPPFLGRPFTRADERPGSRVAVVTERVWVQHLGADASGLGRSITLDGEPHAVVGVVRSGPPDPLAGEVDVWLPIDLESASGSWSGNHLMAYARLAPAASLESARSELDVIAQGHASMEEDAAEKAFTILSLREDLTGDVKPLLVALMAAVVFLLLLTCTNVASLLVARASTRERELAIRGALGCRRGDLLRLFVLETGILALAGGALGLLLGAGALEALLSVAPADLPLRETISLGRMPVAMSAALAVLVGGILGLAIALPHTQQRPGDSMSGGARAGQGGRSARRVRDALVVIDVALAAILLVGAGIMFRTVESLHTRDLGVEVENVIAFQVGVPVGRYPDPESRSRFQNELLARLRRVPGFLDVGSTSHLPVTGSHNTWGTRPVGVEGEGSDPDNLQVDQRIVDEAYFAAVGVRLIAGRLLGPEDEANAPRSVLVNQTAARALFGDADPLGRELAVGPLRPVVVGVVGDVASNARSGADPTVYHAFDQFGAFQRWPIRHLVRLAPGVIDPWNAIRAAIVEVDPSLTIHETVRVSDVVGSDIAQERFAALLLRAFAGLATLLAALGLYGVLGHAVARRRHEIGVHMALGANAGGVRSMVLRQGLGLALTGTSIGLLAALALAQTLDFLVWGVTPRDPAVFLSVTAGIVAIAVAASWLPALAATRIEPKELLRSE